MPTTPLARVERPDDGEREKENLVLSALSDYSNQGAHQSDHDGYIIQTQVANDYCSREHSKSDKNKGASLKMA